MKSEYAIQQKKYIVQYLMCCNAVCVIFHHRGVQAYKPLHNFLKGYAFHLFWDEIRKSRACYRGKVSPQADPNVSLRDLKFSACLTCYSKFGLIAYRLARPIHRFLKTIISELSSKLISDNCFSTF